MTLLSVVKDVSLVVGVNYPTSVFSNITGNRTMQEMLTLANEMAQRIAYDQREWTMLKQQCVFTGDGSTTAFNLPANYKRMLLTANVYRSATPTLPMRFIPDTDEWMSRRARNYMDSRGEWTLLGGQMLIYPALTGGTVMIPPAISVPAATAQFAYLNKNCVALASGGFGDSFLTDGDSYVLDERLLKLGMIWQWKAQKGGSYAEDLGTYSDAIAIASGSDAPGPIIAGYKPISQSATVAYPWPVPT